MRDAGISTLLYLLTLTGFGAAVARATGRLRDGLADRAAALAEEKDVVSLLAETDELTGLANRRRLHAHLTQMLGAAATQGAISVIAFDLDGLKAVNDTQGHHAGDELLRRFAILLQRATRGRDIAARVGGDEFVMALPGTTAEGAAALGRRLEEMADREGRVSYPIRFSYGAAQYERGDSPSRVLERADAALYDAKSRLTRA
ncbi:MAG: GGDEF domain-containing protein [Deltaproteobacteria bacterium]|nr:GGDEF domain-containing protein [Deltaproteobacteria bacterium]